ncbi:acyl transferase domain-containing protein [Xylariaceae sp. FL0255]|nr:acyl transferase domain-containing protein [Xylariaceae sp. FL0255]
MRINTPKSILGHVYLLLFYKTIVALEKGVIQPNALFQKINPEIDTEFHNIKIPTECITWPTKGLRRASVNSFGFGGTNSHLILDDAMHYLKNQELVGNHSTTPLGLGDGYESEIHPKTDGAHGPINGTHLLADNMNGCLNGASSVITPVKPRLLIWSASDESALNRMLQGYNTYYADRVQGSQTKLDQLAYTLAARRSEMTWRTTESSLCQPGVRASIKKALAFVFTGQGVQYAQMGLELLEYPEFKAALLEANEIFKRLGCEWSILDALCDKDKIDFPDHSQPLCTALQIALARLLKSFGVSLSVVIGHSSGEIAAAYAAGALTQESALKVAYHRGQVAAKLMRSASSSGAMMAVNLAASEVEKRLKDKTLSSKGELHIACINSEHNCTVSGDERAIDGFQVCLENRGAVGQKIRTKVAYYSPKMKILQPEYEDLMGKLEAPDLVSTGAVDMISSVTGRPISLKELTAPKYWVDNLISPVRFTEAISTMIEGHGISIIDEEKITDIIEIGPHSALRRPLRESLSVSGMSQMSYVSALCRNESASRTVLDLIGHLFCRGYKVSVSACNQQQTSTAAQPMPFLVDCPRYPFDKSKKYWFESCLSRDYRLRQGGNSEVLGVRAHDWNPLEPRWRKFWRRDTTPWLKDHVINNVVILLGTVMLAMAIEAVLQMATIDRPIDGVYIKDAKFISAISIPEDKTTETVLHLRPLRKSFEKESTWSRITHFTFSDGRWNKCFQATVQLQYEEGQTPVEEGTKRRRNREGMVRRYQQAREICLAPVRRAHLYKKMRESGVTYGKTFELLDDIQDDLAGTAIARVALDDAPIRACIVHSSSGLGDAGVTMVPRQLHNLWISATKWSESATVNIRTSSQRLPDSGETHTDACIFDAATLAPLCDIGQVILAPVARVDSGGHNKPKLLYGVDWKPQLSFLDAEQLCQICGAGFIPEDSTGMSLFYPKLEATMDVVIRKTLGDLEDVNSSKMPWHILNLISWMQRHAAQRPAANPLEDGQPVEECLRQLSEERPKWKLFEVLGNNIMSIIRGQVDTLELLISSGLAEVFYSDIFDRFSDSRLRSFLDLATHENPNVRILEVGGGTGGFTLCILSCLKDLEACRGGNAFAEYTYTDISPGFFETIRDKFGNLAQERLQFRTFNIEKDPSTEGLEVGAYDIIVAGSVIHATSDLVVTLGNIRKAIKPGGYFVFLEVLAPYSVAANIGFDRLLRPAGFSGNDMVFRDYRDEQLSVGIQGTPRDATMYGVLDDQSSRQVAITDKICQHGSELQMFGNRSVLSLWDIKHTELGGQDVVVVLLEMDRPFFSSLSEERFMTLKDMMSKVRNLLWIITLPDPHEHDNDHYAEYHLSVGFLRAMRSKALDRRLVTLVVEDNHSDVSVCATYVTGVLGASLGPYQVSPDDEYVVRNGVLQIRRIYEESALNSRVQALVSPQLQVLPWKSWPPVKLAIRNRGMFDSLEFIEDELPQSHLRADEVEIEAKAWGLSFRDVFVAIGRLDGGSFGYDCAGLIRRTGSEVHDLQPGERVVLGGAGCMRAYPRTTAQWVVRIPKSLSFAAAASMPGESILIHAAPGSTGQMAIWVARMIGAKIFATVGLDTKKQLLIDQFGIPADHIFYSRNTTFTKGVMRATGYRGVGVVLNSLSGDGLRASWECVALFGRFIELGKADIVGNSSLPMTSFARNVSFIAVDLHHMGLAAPDLAAKLVRDMMDLVTRGMLHHPKPLHTYAMSEVEQAFRYMQSGKNTGRTIFRADDADMKRILDRCDWECDLSSSYLVVGGLGGVGREILWWLASNGAQYLIVPSRSWGKNSVEASKVISELTTRGIHIYTPAFDVSDKAALQTVLEECGRDFPPIRGCINASMVLQDAVFENMTLLQWELTLRSKARTSWNLHSQLPRSLDFFVLLSSLAGIYGSPGQSNYAAGCAFQDTLARYRTQRGEKSISFDIENEEYERHRKNTADMGHIEKEEFLSLLDMYCDPYLPLLRPERSQLLVGVVTQRDMIARAQVVTPLVRRPLFAGFSRVSGGALLNGAPDVALDITALYQRAGVSKERGKVVVQALAAKLAKALAVSPDEIDPHKRLSGCGVDSLMAVELRNWVGVHFRAEVAVFEIMGGMTIAAIAKLVIERRDYVRDHVMAHWLTVSQDHQLTVIQINEGYDHGIAVIQ